MKTLYLLRHAKSSWADEDISDFDRPLNDRGLRTAPFMGRLMSREGFEPYVILSSPAKRAKQTAELVKIAGGMDAEIRFENRIYEASPQTLRQVTSELSNNYVSALLVGHNPGIESFARFLTGQLEPFPTAALAAIDLNIESWDLLGEGRGELKRIYRPKDELK